MNNNPNIAEIDKFVRNPVFINVLIPLKFCFVFSSVINLATALPDPAPGRIKNIPNKDIIEETNPNSDKDKFLARNIFSKYAIKLVIKVEVKITLVPLIKVLE